MHVVRRSMTGWKPYKPVSLIVGSRAGGANDVVARVLAQGVREAGGPEIDVVNIPGKSQALAWQALSDASPDGHVLGTASNVLLTSHLAGKSALHYSGFTPVALLVEEYLAFAVAGARSGTADWLGILQSGERPLRVGFIGRAGNARHLAIVTALIAHDQDLGQVDFQGYETEEEAMHGLMSGHCHVYCDTAGAVSVLVKSETVFPVAVSAKGRLAGVYRDTPCLVELGVKEPFTAWRAIIGPPDMPGAAIAYWVDTFRALSATQAWARVLEQHHWGQQFLGAQAFADFLDGLSASLERCLAALDRIRPQ
jgi:putative tricarboxylic transport membrane protein